MKNKIEFKVCNQANNPEAYRECEEFIKHWQKILNIQDWAIKLEFLSADEISETMGSSNYRGFCERNFFNKEATIGLNIEYQDINDCIDQTILHEMLHIVTGEYQFNAELLIGDNKFAEEVLKIKLEQMVDGLAKSLLHAYNIEPNGI